jgi:DNA-binding response OmpR family regulator
MSDAHPETEVLRGARILVAEDEPAARRAVASALRSCGAEVIETADGGRMLVALTGHYKDGHSPSELDLVVTDIDMPVVSGLDVFQGLRAAHWKTPVIVVTGLDTTEVADLVERLDAVLLPKPLDLDLFFETARRLVARRRLLQQRRRDPP